MKIRKKCTLGGSDTVKLGHWSEMHVVHYCKQKSFMH